MKRATKAPRVNTIKLTKIERRIYERYLNGARFLWDSEEHHILFKILVKKVKVSYI